MSYLQIANKHPQYLGYGALHYFFSCIGQTFLISILVPFMVPELNITNQIFSNGYAVATIVSAFSLPLIGSWVDRAKLTTISLLGGLGLILSCLVMFASDSLWLLVPGLFLLRFFGQGSMILIGSTTIAKFFSKNRGKALSLASIGLALAETIMPVIIIAFVNQFGWRETWLFLALAVLVIFIPASNLLIKKHKSVAEEVIETSSSKSDFTRTQVLKDPNFYLILPAFIFLPFFITGIFIHQNLLAAAKGWTMEWMALCFIGYGVSKVAMSFLGGALIDRYSGSKVFIFYLLPLALGLLCLLLGDQKILGLIYMVLLGMTTSLGSLSGVAIWAELYGVKNLAAIKSMVTTFLVVSTALGPIVIGYTIEWSLDWTLIISVLAMVVIMATSWWTIEKRSRRRTGN